LLRAGWLLPGAAEGRREAGRGEGRERQAVQPAERGAGLGTILERPGCAARPLSERGQLAAGGDGQQASTALRCRLRAGERLLGAAGVAQRDDERLRPADVRRQAVAAHHADRYGAGICDERGEQVGADGRAAHAAEHHLLHVRCTGGQVERLAVRPGTGKLVGQRIDVAEHVLRVNALDLFEVVDCHERVSNRTCHRVIIGKEVLELGRAERSTGPAAYLTTRYQMSVLSPASNTLIFSSVMFETSMFSNRRSPSPNRTGIKPT